MKENRPDLRGKTGCSASRKTELATQSRFGPVNDCSGGSTAKRRQENATETNRNESTSVAIVPTPDRPTLRDGLLPAADAAGGTAHQKQIPEPLAPAGRSARPSRHASPRSTEARPWSAIGWRAHAREVLGQLRLPEAYLGWTMVMLPAPTGGIGCWPRPTSGGCCSCRTA